MNKQFLLLSVVLLIGYLALVFCDENHDYASDLAKTSDLKTESTELFDEARTRRRHKLFHLFWGWHALAIAYWIKVKVVIVAFFLGSAVFLGLRYFWPHKCKSEIGHDGPIIYENPHTFSHHDHVPYALEHHDHIDHSFEHSFEPYSGYAGAYSDSAPGTVDISGPPDGHSVNRRSLDMVEARQRQSMSTEERIAEMMFSFLGLDSKACRRRFICEMEFRSKRNPISSMAFRIVGRGFFEKYTNAHNKLRRATSFSECALVNPDCVFIEHDENDDDGDDNDTTVAENLESITEVAVNADVENATKVDASKNDVEAENETNLIAERQHAKRRRRTHRNLEEIRRRIFRQRI